MADGNGIGRIEVGGPPPTRSSETAVFRVGGQDIRVPALNLDTLIRMKDQIRSLNGEMTVVEYSMTVFEIIADSLAETRPDLTLDVLRKVCSFPEAQGVIAAWSNLLEVSGFPVGEAEPVPEAANPGTGTLTNLSPNSEPEGFVAETPIG